MPALQALGECRAAIADDESLNSLHDGTLARFLRNNSWDVAASIAQLKEYLQWRQKEKIDSILDSPNYADRERIRTIIPHAYHGEDKEGRPIYIEKTGMIATAALADSKLCPEESLLTSHIVGLERMMRQMHETSLKRGKRVNGITTILDMTGLGFHHRQCLFVLKTCLEFDKKYYPEYLGKLFVINSPWVAPYLYQAVQVFLDEVTKSRVRNNKHKQAAQHSVSHSAIDCFSHFQSLLLLPFLFSPHAGSDRFWQPCRVPSAAH